MNVLIPYPCNQVDCVECPFYEECDYWDQKEQFSEKEELKQSGAKQSKNNGR